MSRSHGFSGVSKVVAAAAAQTITFPANEIEGSGVVAFDIFFTGGIDIADVTEVRILASGVTIHRYTPAQLRTWMEGTQRTGSIQATTATTLHLPLYMPDLLTMDERDSCQFPIGAQPEVQIDLADTVPAGTARIGWTKSDMAPAWASRFYTNNMNIAASQNNAKYVFSDGGIIRGIVINTVGVSRARLIISGRTVFDLSGAQYLGVATGDLLLLTRMLESPSTLTDPFFIPVSLGLPAAAGSSYLELDTGAGWAGVGNNIAIWSAVPLAAAQEEGA